MKKLILGIAIFISFIIILSIVIVGIDIKDCKKTNNNEESLKNEVISLKDYKIEDMSIGVYITKDKTVKRMNIEEYVKGVVAGEMPANFNIEALKAQAIAARTYGIAHIKNLSQDISVSSTSMDLDDTTSFQVYMSKDDRFKLWPNNKASEYWKKISSAVEETKGEVLVYDNDLIKEPFYFSTSSGKTEDAKDVFGKEVPYLKSVKSKGEEIAPKYNTESKYSYKEFIDILNKSGIKENLDENSLKKQVKILERSDAGTVKSIKIGEKSITGSNFRKIFNLASSNFSIEYNMKDICIACRGYGHGVGMSQWGANVMGKEGKDYKDILKHYYTGTKIFKLSF